MKKKIFALVLALAMALSLAACGDSNTPAGSGSGSGSGEEPANISGDLVICSSATDLDLEAITEGFTALYPDVNIEIITCSAGEGVARVEAEGDNPTIDVFYSGLNQADGDKYAGIFENYVSSHDSELPEEYQSNNGFYNYDHLSSVVFCVNTDLEAELGIEINKNVYLSARNLQRAEVILASNVNSYKVLNADVVVITEKSLETIDQILTK